MIYVAAWIACGVIYTWVSIWGEGRLEHRTLSAKSRKCSLIVAFVAGPIGVLHVLTNAILLLLLAAALKASGEI